MVTTAYLAIIILLHHGQSQTNFICNDVNGCSDQTLTCDQSADCWITCVGSTTASCNHSTIICPSGPHSCNVACDSTQSWMCAYTQIDASNIVGADLTINVNEGPLHYSLGYADIKCPISGNCVITVAKKAPRALFYSTIDASHTISGSLNIYSEGDDRSGHGLTVLCPPNGHCTIDAGFSWGACETCTITAQPTTTLLHIRARGTRALAGAIITCPQRPSTAVNCIITSDNAYQSDVLANMRIYSVQSFTNLHISYTGNTASATMYCMNDYTESCEVVAYYTTWKCQENSSPCQNWASTSPTKEPSHPSHVPSEDPTVEPTWYPSVEPTVEPTLVTTMETEADTYTTDTIAIDTEDGNDSTYNSFGFIDYLIAGCVSFVCCLICVVCGCYFCTKHGQSQKNAEIIAIQSGDGTIPDVQKTEMTENATDNADHLDQMADMAVLPDDPDDEHVPPPGGGGDADESDEEGEGNVDEEGGEGNADESCEENESDCVELRAWMKRPVGLEQYTEMMIYSGYRNMKDLEVMTLDDLKEMGVRKVAHRRKIYSFAQRLVHTSGYQDV
eukprot:654671_1